MFKWIAETWTNRSREVFILAIASSLLFDAVIFLLLASHTWYNIYSEPSDIAGLPRLYRILVRDGKVYFIRSSCSTKLTCVSGSAYFMQVMVVKY